MYTITCSIKALTIDVNGDKRYPIEEKTAWEAFEALQEDLYLKEDDGEFEETTIRAYTCSIAQMLENFGEYDDSNFRGFEKLIDHIKTYTVVDDGDIGDIEYGEEFILVRTLDDDRIVRMSNDIDDEAYEKAIRMVLDFENQWAEKYDHRPTYQLTVKEEKE